ncbi:hypothetical protein [Bacillus sp. B4EP4a]|uniref:hypothetical protein n=1 Tax=Bacillus sp. B4EP4a TaxID=2590665 RepID=UPI00114D8065|nr:hypothetical protein [Bacillus sp. B4EP4a]
MPREDLFEKWESLNEDFFNSLRNDYVYQIRKKISKYNNFIWIGTIILIVITSILLNLIEDQAELILLSRGMLLPISAGCLGLLGFLIAAVSLSTDFSKDTNDKLINELTIIKLEKMKLLAINLVMTTILTTILFIVTYIPKDFNEFLFVFFSIILTLSFYYSLLFIILIFVLTNMSYYLLKDYRDKVFKKKKEIIESSQITFPTGIFSKNVSVGDVFTIDKNGDEITIRSKDFN